MNENNDDDELPEYWPRPGDRLFIQNKYGYDAEIAVSPAERSYRMKKAFKDAADLLVSYTEDTPNAERNMLWPIVFCYRQYIELALKDAIAKHGRDIEPPILPDWTKLEGKPHQLRPLWEACKKIMAAALMNTSLDEIPEIAVIEACIHEFDDVDDGYSFRFPTDSRGRHIEISIASIDLPHLRSIMSCVYAFLDANESVLNAHFGGDL